MQPCCVPASGGQDLTDFTVAQAAWLLYRGTSSRTALVPSHEHKAKPNSPMTTGSNTVLQPHGF
jgi:hypothetical protein